MAKIKIQPTPGNLLVQPIYDRVNDITVTMGGGSTPRSGKIVRLPMENNKLRSREVACESDHISLKIGDIVFYESENPTTFTVDGAEYHLISNWSIIAKQG